MGEKGGGFVWGDRDASVCVYVCVCLHAQACLNIALLRFRHTLA